MTAPYDEGPNWDKIFLQSTWATRTVEFMVGPEGVEALSSIEFAARRRTAQDEAIAFLLPEVKDFIEQGPDAVGELAEKLTRLYLDTYLGEGGDRKARTAAFIRSLRSVLSHTEPDSDPTTAATWLAVATINAATLQAGVDDPRPILLKWTTMHDKNVREAHAAADRQRRPAGALFHVGGENLLYPGDPRGSLENTVNCRCVLQPVPFYGPEAASLAAAAAKEIDMPLEAPLAWHGVLAPEGIWSGDGRRFALDSLRNRDLPLPLTWQKASGEGHNGSTVVARIDSIERVPGEDGTSLMQAEGIWIDTPETDEVVGLLAEFGRFGVSVDADDSEFEFDEESGQVTFTSARIASASLVSIPAFAEAWIALGTWADAEAAFPPEKEGAPAEEDEGPEEDCDPDAPDYEECLAAKQRDKEGDDERWEKVDPEASGATVAVSASQGTTGGPVEMISDAAWDGSAGRFSPEQWKSSCILHVCTGDEKSCHKLPIKEPGGALSRAGVHAAASRFNQVDAPTEAKASAARSLRGAYKQLGEEPPDAIKATLQAAESFGRGPGWVTHPADTKRIHDYWTKKGEPGYAKIDWGVPGDFNRCRALVGEKIAANSPEDVRFLNQICAQWHHDAIGFWPGRAPSEQSLSQPKEGTPAPALSLVAAGAIKAPAAWFQNPNLAGPTHLQVTEEGRVFGHIAEWSSCHIGYEGVCVAPPESESGYAYYASKSVLLDDGTSAATGVISLGGGHADGRLGLRAAIAHYDSTSTGVADVAVGQDEFGIWCAGWMRPGWTERQAYDLRASDISGDWREVRPGQMELVAALAVNVAGFPTVAVRDRVQVALVAAGVVAKHTEDDPMSAVVAAVVAALGRRDKMAALRQRVGV
jgi:hypothetical protein